MFEQNYGFRGLGLFWTRSSLAHESAHVWLQLFMTHTYTLFQNGRHFSVLLFACKLALVASFKGK